MSTHSDEPHPNEAHSGQTQSRTVGEYQIKLNKKTSTELQEDFEQRFAREAHIRFILNLDSKNDSLEYHMTEHLRISGVYWALMAIDLVGGLHLMDKDSILKYVMSCYDEEIGGFGGSTHHDVHLLYTLSALQILAILGSLDNVDSTKITSYIKSLQRDDGAFMGDKWGEIDTRFSYVALNCLALLDTIEDQTNKEQLASNEDLVCKAVEFIGKCRNFDGGFGAVPGAESHAGQIFCCVAALAIANKVDDCVDKDVLGWLLCERQLKCGGLNGRPEKKEDVCYSWWVLASLSILDRADWIDKTKLGDFILSAQDHKNGGISDRPDTMTDIFHTYFGFAGLSLLGYPGFEAVDPVYALPTRIVKALELGKVTTQQDQK